jgi:HSP20 family molecular chaperone IbpA
VDGVVRIMAILACTAHRRRCNLFVGHRAPWVAGALVALILAGSVGGAYALSETTSGDLAERYVATLAGAERADINIDFGAGSLVIESLPEGSPDLIDASYFGRRGKTNIRRSGDTAIVDIDMDGQNFFRTIHNARWELALSTVPQITLDLDGGAAEMEVDLRGLRVTDLDVSVGAADVRIVLPETGILKADVRGGAADINITVPDGVAARITNNSSLSSVNIDTSRFPKFGKVYESLNFDEADNRVILHINVGAADVTVR